MTALLLNPIATWPTLLVGALGAVIFGLGWGYIIYRELYRDE